MRGGERVVCYAPVLSSASRKFPLPTLALALIRRDITYLASEALEGRAPGTPGNDSAAAYIARLYLSLHLERANIPVSTPPVCPAA